VALRAAAFLEMLTKLVATRATTARSLLDVFSPGWVGKRYDFVQVGRQHSRYKAILLSIALSQQCCKVYFRDRAKSSSLASPIMNSQFPGWT